jgi:hypothetical protein
LLDRSLICLQYTQMKGPCVQRAGYSEHLDGTGRVP